MDLSIIESGFTLAAVGIAIVFCALTGLYIAFKFLGRITSGNLTTKSAASSETAPAFNLTGETNAAIGLALHLYFSELHDEETLALTINRISKRYSPWSSKIYGVINGLNRRF